MKQPHNLYRFSRSPLCLGIAALVNAIFAGLTYRFTMGVWAMFWTLVHHASATLYLHLCWLVWTQKNR